MKRRLAAVACVVAGVLVCAGVGGGVAASPLLRAAASEPRHPSASSPASRIRRSGATPSPDRAPALHPVPAGIERVAEVAFDQQFASVDLQVINAAGRGPAWLSVDGCTPFGIPDRGTRWTLQVSPGTCVFQAIGTDGALRVWSDAVELTVVAGEHYDVALAFPRERTGGLGVGIRTEDDGVRVMSVHDDTPAADAGLERGDLIVEVDGLPANALTLQEFQQVMTGPEGTTVSFVVAYEGDTGDVTERLTIRRAYLTMDGDGNVHRERLPPDTGG